MTVRRRTVNKAPHSGISTWEHDYLDAKYSSVSRHKTTYNFIAAVILLFISLFFITIPWLIRNPQLSFSLISASNEILIGKILGFIVGAFFFYLSMVGFYCYYRQLPKMNQNSVDRKLVGLAASDSGNCLPEPKEKDSKKKSSSAPKQSPKDIYSNKMYYATPKSYQNQEKTSLMPEPNSPMDIDMCDGAQTSYIFKGSPQRIHALESSPITNTYSVDPFLKNTRRGQAYVSPQQPQQHQQSLFTTPSSNIFGSQTPLNGRSSCRTQFNTPNASSPYLTPTTTSAYLTPSPTTNPYYQRSPSENYPHLKTPPYATSYVESPAKVTSTEAANRLLSDLHIAHYMDHWAQEMRKWIAQSIIKQVSKDFHTNDKDIDFMCGRYLQQCGYNLSFEERQFLSSTSPMTREQRIAYLSPKCQAGSKEYSYIKKRADLNRYLDLKNRTSRTGTFAGGASGWWPKYVLERIHQLAEGYSLRDYKWNKGGTYDSEAWGPHLPTDAQILIHCFCVFMDDYIDNFSRNHYRNSSDKSSVKMITIVRSSKSKTEPYYYIKGAIKDNGPRAKARAGQWAVLPGRLNAFLTLSLFIYYVKEYLKGELDHTDFKLEGLSELIAVVNC